jgi:uncharacterized protein YcfL
MMQIFLILQLLLSPLCSDTQVTQRLSETSVVFTENNLLSGIRINRRITLFLLHTPFTALKSVQRLLHRQPEIKLQNSTNHRAI